jgi:signal transduction histidine kinase
MLVTASRIKRLWPELLWAAFAAANVGAMIGLHEWQTVPFHFVWVSLTILYGFRVWKPLPTAAVLVVVCLATGYALLTKVLATGEGIDEMTEVPLMSAMFLAMVWHARRRDAALREARAAAEREREFIRDASHLLRTPITVARGHAELVAATTSGQEGRDLEVVVEELGRLSRISDRLLLLATAEHPHFTTVRDVRMGSLVKSTVERWSVAADRDWGCESGCHGTVRGDEERLVAAIDAIIENAVKHTRSGDRITVRGRAEGDQAVLEVADGGAGIPPETLPRIFERFVRGAPNGNGGTGLGLPIVKAIVEAHGGSIAVASAPGEGTTVRLRLPGFTPVMNSA